MPPTHSLTGPYALLHSTDEYITTPEFHSHDYYELYFYLSGNATIVIEEFSYLLHPGDVVLLPPGRMHRAVHHAQQGYYERYLIYVTCDFLARVSAADYPLLQLLESAAAQSHFIAHPSGEELLGALSSMNALIASSGATAQQGLINSCTLTILLARLCGWFSSPCASDMPHAPGTLSNVIAYINAHLSDDLSLDSLAARFSINKYSLLRTFKDYAQVTLHQYILQKRILRAKDLLRTGTPPSQVYAACGYYDYSSFFKAFRKQTNMTPQQFADVSRVENAAPIPK